MTPLIVLLIAVLFAAMGGLALVRPERILAFVGTQVLTRDGRNEVRAVYGGFGLAIAALLGATHFDAGIRSGALLAVALALLGMAAGRLLSMLLDGLPGRYPRLFLAVELCGAAAPLAAWRSGSPA